MMDNLVLAWQEQLSSQMGQSISRASSRLAILASRLLEDATIDTAAAEDTVETPLGLARLPSLLVRRICLEGDGRGVSVCVLVEW